MRVLASHKEITVIEVREEKLILIRQGDYIMFNHRFPRLTAKTLSKKLDEIIEFLRNI